MGKKRICFHTPTILEEEGIETLSSVGRKKGAVCVNMTPQGGRQRSKEMPLHPGGRNQTRGTLWETESAR